MLLAALLALVVSASAAAATVEGTKRADRLSGTARDDMILPRAGADRVTAGAGQDRIAAQYDGGRDTIVCGAGVDVVNADANDRVASDCEIVSRRISRDLYRNPESHHETQVEPDSFSFGSTLVTAFQSGRVFDGSAANIGFATSTDGGRGWRRGELPGLTRYAPQPGPSARASDPVVAYDALHATWLVAALAVGDATRLTVSRSPDGLAWSDPVDATSATRGTLAYDKEWLTCDNSPASPFRGRCYLAYTDLVRGGLSLQTSLDGALTWSPPVAVSPLLLVGALPVVQPGGRLVILFRRELGVEDALAAVRSDDGGLTLGQPVQIGSIRAAPIGYRGPPLPNADAAANGEIAVVWPDCRFRATCDGNDVLLARSADGVSWSAPESVTAGRNVFIPTIAIDAATGRAAVAFYVERRNGADLEVTESVGGSWSPPQRLNAQPMPPPWLARTNQGPMFGDYISASYAAGRLVVVSSIASEPDAKLRQATFATALR